MLFVIGRNAATCACRATPFRHSAASDRWATALCTTSADARVQRPLQRAARVVSQVLSSSPVFGSRSKPGGGALRIPVKSRTLNRFRNRHRADHSLPSGGVERLCRPAVAGVRSDGRPQAGRGGFLRRSARVGGQDFHQHRHPANPSPHLFRASRVTSLHGSLPDVGLAALFPLKLR